MEEIYAINEYFEPKVETSTPQHAFSLYKIGRTKILENRLNSCGTWVPLGYYIEIIPFDSMILASQLEKEVLNICVPYRVKSLNKTKLSEVVQMPLCDLKEIVAFCYKRIMTSQKEKKMITPSPPLKKQKIREPESTPYDDNKNMLLFYACVYYFSKKIINASDIPNIGILESVNEVPVLLLTKQDLLKVLLHYITVIKYKPKMLPDGSGSLQELITPSIDLYNWKGYEYFIRLTKIFLINTYNRQYNNYLTWNDLLIKLKSFSP